MSLGIRPRVELAKQAGLRIGETGAIWVNEKMETSAEGVYAAGDCAETTHLITGRKFGSRWDLRRINRAEWSGLMSAAEMPHFRGSWERAIFKTFDFNVAKTGLNMREAEKEGFHPVQAIVRGFDRAHYYPGRKESTLKVIADKETGRILGGAGHREGSVGQVHRHSSHGSPWYDDCSAISLCRSGLCPSVQPCALTHYCGSQCSS